MYTNSKQHLERKKTFFLPEKKRKKLILAEINDRSFSLLFTSCKSGSPILLFFLHLILQLMTEPKADDYTGDVEAVEIWPLTAGSQECHKAEMLGKKKCCSLNAFFTLSL